MASPKTSIPIPSKLGDAPVSTGIVCVVPSTVEWTPKVGDKVFHTATGSSPRWYVPGMITLIRDSGTLDILLMNGYMVTNAPKDFFERYTVKKHGHLHSMETPKPA